MCASEVIQFSRRFIYSFTLIFFIGFYPVLTLANTAFHEDVANLYQGDFYLGVGAGIVKFNSNIKVNGKERGSTSYIDLEGDLNLPEISHVTTFYGAYRFNEKHSLLWSYFAINRQASLLQLDENYKDIIIINADVTISDNTRFYNLNYGYSLFDDNRSDITFVVGLNGLDLRLLVEAKGQIAIGSEIKSVAEVAEADVFVPLPLLGLNFRYSYTPKWSISTKISLVGGTYNDVSAMIMQTSINSIYQFSQHAGLILGLTYFTADVSIEDETSITDVNYGYTGAFIGMHFGF